MPQDSSDKTQTNDEKVEQSPEPFSRMAWICFIAGFVLLVVGHILLYLAGRDGGNFAGRMAPLVIVLGYAVFGAGFLPHRRK